MGLTKQQALALASARARAQQSQPAVPGLRDRARAFAQGATLGFQDEAAGAMGALASMADPRVTAGPREVYRDIQQAEQAAQQQFASENPGQNLALQLAGGVATGRAAGRAAMSMPVRMGLPPVNPAPVGAATQAIARGANLGAVFGGVAGAGNAQDMASVPREVVRGAAIGGVAGGALTAGTEAASAAVRALAPGVRGRLQQMAKSTGMTVDQLRERLRAFGPAGTLADISDNFRAGAGTAAARLGLTMRRIKDYERRSEQAFSRLMEPITRHLGNMAGAAQTERQIRDHLRTQASPLYEQAFQQPIEMTKNLRGLFARPAVQQAWARTRKVGANDLDVPLEALKNGQLPSFRGWQYITELLHDQAETLSRQGANKPANLVRDLRRAILAELDVQSPEFAQARAMWANDKQAEEAIELGKRFWNSSMSEIDDTVSNLDPGAVPFYRIGVGRAMEEKLARVQDTADITSSMRTPAFRAKLRTALGDDRVASEFANNVRVEAEFQRTKNILAQQSITAGRLAAERQMGGSPIVSEGVDAASGGGVFDFARRMIKSGIGPQEKTIQTLGDMLTSSDPRIQQAALAMMRENPPKDLGPAVARLMFITGQQAGAR